MHEYRAYLLNKDGRIASAKNLICPDDDSALKQAKQYVDGHDVEVWSGARVVGKIKHGK